MMKYPEGAKAPPALFRSRAGMRLIALLSIYNRGDFKRAKEYLREQSAPHAFTAASLAERLAELRLQRRNFGRVRFKQIAGISELNVIAILTTEKDEMSLLVQLSVESEYPHSLTHWQMTVLEKEKIRATEIKD